MRVLIDTHIVLGLLRRDQRKKFPEIMLRLSDPATIAFVSVASLWEIAIKTRLGRLNPGMPLEDIASFLDALGLAILPIQTLHVIGAADPEPETRDPFDRLLLAQCQTENLFLATVDRALIGHPLVWRV
jgi:PIN domain nuclease of toxin-antitoxin system